MKKLLLIVLLIVGCEETTEPDTTVPTVVITYPANGTLLTQPDTVKVNVADAGNIISVKFLIDGTEVFADSSAPYNMPWDVCAYGDGGSSNHEDDDSNKDNPHTVLVTAEDDSDNTGQSDLFTYPISATYDCADVCGGDKVEDCSGECGGDAVEIGCLFEGSWMGNTSQEPTSSHDEGHGVVVFDINKYGIIHDGDIRIYLSYETHGCEFSWGYRDIGLNNITINTDSSFSYQSESFQFNGDILSNTEISGTLSYLPPISNNCNQEEIQLTWAVIKDSN